MPDLNRNIGEEKVVSDLVVIYMTFISLSSTVNSEGLGVDIFDGKPHNDPFLQHTIQHITFAKQLEERREKRCVRVQIPNLWNRQGGLSQNPIKAQV